MGKNKPRYTLRVLMADHEWASFFRFGAMRGMFGLEVVKNTNYRPSID